jgi:O-antigen/teichoic acid export membrane protein
MLAAFAGLYIPLSVIGDYGLSKQVAEITYTLSVVWFVTFYPKITQHKISNNNQQLRRMYFKALFIASAVFIVCLSGVLLLGDFLLNFIGSQTHFISLWLLILLMFSALFDGFTYIST